MSTSQKVEILVEGGKVTPGPPLGPALGPLGVNIKAVADKINEETQSFAGMKVPVTVEIQPKGKFSIHVGVPPTSALILSEIGLEKGGGEAGREVSGNITIEQCVKVAKMKHKSLLATDLKGAVKEVLGTCMSCGITVEDFPPKEVQKNLDEGIYDKLL